MIAGSSIASAAIGGTYIEVTIFDLRPTRAISRAFDIDPSYGIIPGVPVIRVNRTEDTVTVMVKNKEDTQIRVYRAEDYRGNFSPIVITDDNPYEDTDIDPKTNYKYKVSFAMEGEIDGELETAESRRSKTKYTRATE